MNVSIICTVFNESHTISKLLTSLANQTRLPDEIILVDGGSTDDTVAILQAYAAQSHVPVRVIVEAGANISRGRNIAIEAAAGPIIASTDAGVCLADHWLAELVKPFADKQTSEVLETSEVYKPVSIVAGFFLPDPQTIFEVAMSATVLPTLADINPATFLPSSRSVAFLKSSWAQVGGYPEWLDFCEDLIFDFRLRDLFGTFAFAPQAIAYFQPRSTLSAFFKQYYYYARGDGKADLFRLRHVIRYFTYLIALPALIMLSIAMSPWWSLLIFFGLGAMFKTAYRRLGLLWGKLSFGQKLQAIGWVPLIRITGDVAKMMGYPVGWRWRLARV